MGTGLGPGTGERDTWMQIQGGAHSQGVARAGLAWPWVGTLCATFATFLQIQSYSKIKHV